MIVKKLYRIIFNANHVVRYLKNKIENSLLDLMHCSINFIDAH